MTEIPEDVMKAAREAFADTKVISASLVAEDEDSDVLPYIINRAARAILAEREAQRERDANICEAQKQEFLSPQYASNQPFGSLTERFACDECAAAIRNPA